MKALLSVYDKTGIVDLAKHLHHLKYELISTGGTFDAIANAGIPVRQVSDVTGFPEMMDGRVKTLHPRVHAGILARRDMTGHMAELAAQNIDPLDVVVVNLYPFVQTVSRPGVTLQEAIENIDIGGPTLLRAAAKNYLSVVVLTDPTDYDKVAEKLALEVLGLNKLSMKERKELAAKAFRRVAAYDAAVSRYLTDGEGFPQELPVGLAKISDLRYGENPHQQGAFYSVGLEWGGIAGAKQLHGKELSFNNILDADAAWNAVAGFEDPAVSVIKHTNPCGLAVHENQVEAYTRAHAGDPVSAFGGIVGFNRPVTRQTAQAMSSVFYEVVVAPAYDGDALEVLQAKKNIRLLEVPPLVSIGRSLDVRRVSGGLLVQDPDSIAEDPSSWTVASERPPTKEELADLAFAWRVCKHIKSNAIVLAKDRGLLGMGAGQPNRVVSVRLALQAAAERAGGSALASDAFFPFPDSIETAAEGGVTAVVQPGGSIRDEEVIAAANRLNLAMVFTGVRHFRH